MLVLVSIFYSVREKRDANGDEDQNPDKGLYLLCQDHAHCEDFHFSDIDLKTSVSHSRLSIRRLLIMRHRPENQHQRNAPELME